MNYYLKTSDGMRVWRLAYSEVRDAGDTVVGYQVASAHVCATGAAASFNNMTITEPDTAVDIAVLVVDFIVSGLVPATLTEYRTRAKAMVDGSWD